MHNTKKYDGQKLFGEKELKTTEQRMATVTRSSGPKTKKAYCPGRNNKTDGSSPTGGGGGKRG